MKIHALDLGKFNSVACFFNSKTRKSKFLTTPTHQERFAPKECVALTEDACCSLGNLKTSEPQDTLPTADFIVDRVLRATAKGFGQFRNGNQHRSGAYDSHSRSISNFRLATTQPCPYDDLIAVEFKRSKSLASRYTNGMPNISLPSVDPICFANIASGRSNRGI
ncbi:hypothetical protein Rcae01_06431 [Novipirellula caenicola]|uniref:Uncharacterized protein n=1 Tax=Novipirellula caenicola TaxID=1536901 RepID=A0ABP9W0M0_9BACT